MNKEQIQDLIKNRNYPGGGQAKLVETHAHWVVLTPSHVFKIKKPLGLGIEYFDNRPWEVVERYFQETDFEERYGGWVYFSIASKSSC